MTKEEFETLQLGDTVDYVGYPSSPKTGLTVDYINPTYESIGASESTKYNVSAHYTQFQKSIVLPVGQANVPLDKNTQGCDHEWATYNSGFTKYNFCVKCDVRR